MAQGKDSDRAKKTLYLTGFDPRRTTKDLLEELFMQGGPVVDLKMFDSHAYVQFMDQESVPYCIALFNDIELHGRKLRISPRHKSRQSLQHLKYLMKVRETLMAQYKTISPPVLPPKIMPTNNRQSSMEKMRAKRSRFDAKSRNDRRTEHRSSTNDMKRSSDTRNHNLETHHRGRGRVNSMKDQGRPNPRRNRRR